MIMLVLPLGFFALTRSNPELHMTILSKGIELVGPYMGVEGEAGSTTMAQRFQDRVKVNRFGNSGQGNAFGGGSGSARADTQAQADDIGRTLSNIKVGG
jgi:hypothetical protein